MLFTFVALLATASFSAAAPAETVELPIEGSTESRAAYKPCQVLEPKCCPDNPFGFTIIGPPSLKCQQRESFQESVLPARHLTRFSCLVRLRIQVQSKLRRGGNDSLLLHTPRCKSHVCSVIRTYANRVKPLVGSLCRKVVNLDDLV